MTDNAPRPGSALTSTSYAILGLLAIRPWSSYELTKQMKRSLGRFWPRAASKLYEEPRKLVAHALATARPEQSGKRSRTVYAITATGRDELAAWLRRPAQDPLLESEQLLKVFLADHGSIDDLRATITAMGAWASERAAHDAEIARSYIDGIGPFPARLAQLVLIGRYSAELARMTSRWARWADGVVASWPSEVRDATPDRESLDNIARGIAGDPL